jgi:predicted permease
MMNQTIFVINAILPILLLLGTGHLLRRTRLLNDATVNSLKKIVVNITLPAVLFTSFLETTLKSRYLVLMGLVFMVCILLYFVGRLVKNILKQKWQYFPFLFTGFEFGMLGLSLFGTAYGMANFGSMAILGIPHELFIWFVYLTLLKIEGGQTTSIGKIVKSFITSPLIIAIFLSVSINLLGLTPLIKRFLFSDGIFQFLHTIAGLTGPIILLMVGYEIHITMDNLKPSLSVVFLRLGMLVPFALLLNHFVLDGALGLSSNFQAAFFTLLILPPPFIIPIFMKEGLDEEKAFINNALMLHTVASIILFIVYFALNPYI